MIRSDTSRFYNVDGITLHGVEEERNLVKKDFQNA
jgi:hypothetical protein